MTIYLYIKQCSHCNLKYFGKTIRDPLKYKGSGRHWKNHLKKHNSYPVNCQVFYFDGIVEASGFAINFSIENDIVKSKTWANEIIETALDGGAIGTKQSKETIEKRVSKNRGKKRTPAQILNLKIAACKRDNTNVGKNTARKINTPHGIFTSLTEASTHLKCSIASVSKKVNSEKYIDWYKIT
jgi:hypothetical protein